MKAVNCWEYMQCGTEVMEECPAFPHSGRCCYLISGTMGNHEVQGSYLLKIPRCRQCEFYRLLQKEQGRKPH